MMWWSSHFGNWIQTAANWEKDINWKARRQYHNPSPNAVWHADGYDKLKPYGFPIHGCIDGWSRKLLWLVVTRSNNSPNNIGYYFLDTGKTCGVCPSELATDLGTRSWLPRKLFPWQWIWPQICCLPTKLKDRGLLVTVSKKQIMLVDKSI